MSRIAAVETILEVICRTTGMRFSAVAQVTETRWVACAVRDEISFGVGLGDELPIGTTICDRVRRQHERVVIDDVSQDSAYAAHDTPRMYGFQSYISVPITMPDGSFFGTLCAIDPLPATPSDPATLGMFTLFAELVAFHIDAQDKLARGESALRQELQIAELREQFIAILGHDLRNPLAAIDAGAQLLSHASTEPRVQQISRRIRTSARRIASLISDVTDFTRGRLGGGFALERCIDDALAAALEHVVDELRAAHPGRTVDASIAVPVPVDCDVSRVGQLFSNLLSNAITHGHPAEAVRVRAHIDGDTFELSIANGGEPIPVELLERLFEPFTRATSRRGGEGLGLGLYIASQIARAHGGALRGESGPGETRFTFRMPLVRRPEPSA